MKKKLLFTAAIFFVMAMGVNAQGKDETAVGNAVNKLRQAMVDGNKTDLDNVVLNKLSYGHSSGHIEGKQEFVEKIVNGQSDFVTIDLSEQTISVSGKTAIVRHVLKAKINDNGKPGEIHLRILLVWQKQKGNWKLLARQAVKVVS